MNSLQTLKELTPSLPNFPHGENGNGFKEYEMDCGTCFGWKLFESGDKIGVHRWFNSAGTEFPRHSHPEREWIIVYTGSMTLRYDTNDVVLKVGDYVMTPPDTAHSATFYEDCKYITITIPASEDFPHG